MDYLSENLRLLGQRNRSLADYIEGLKIPAGIVAVRSRSGHYTVRVMDRSGKEVFLHSPADPAKEARELIKDRCFQAEDGTILFGFGLGYLSREIARKKEPGHVLYVAEAIPALFKLAAMYGDLSALLADESTFFFIGDAVYGIVDHFRHIQIKTITGVIRKLAAPALMKSCEEVYREAERRISEHVVALQVGLHSFQAHRELLLANPFQNVQALTRSSSIKGLEGLIQGCPTLLVSAGPSLTNDLPLIRQSRNDVFLIAVDSALKPLLNHGIRPDLALTCDPLPLNADKINGLQEEVLRSIPLVYLPESCPGVPGAFGGMKFVVDSANLLSSWLVRLGHDTVAFPLYQTVSHLGFLLARFMGGNPIILVGLDLSFPMEKHHAEGTAKTWSVDFRNTQFTHVPSNNGGSVKTIPGFVTNIHVMEREIRHTPARCINVSRDGALIKGTKRMPLKEALRLGSTAYRQGLSLSFGSLLAGAHRAETSTLREAYKAGLKWFVSEAERMSTLCRDASGMNDPFQHGGGILKEMAPQTPEQAELLYESEFLRTLRDFLPRSIQVSERFPGGESAANRAESRKYASQERSAVLFQELSSILPDLLIHSRRALEQLQGICI